MARLLAITRASGRTRTGTPSISAFDAAGILDIEVVESLSRQDHIEAFQAAAAERGGLGAEAGHPEPAGIPRGAGDAVVQSLQPQIQVLGGQRRPLEHGRAEPDDQEAHAALVESAK